MPPPARRKVGWRERARFRLSDHGDALGVPLAVLALAVLFSLGWFALAPRSPARDVTGQITGMGFVEQEGRGSVSTASVRIADGFTRVRLPARHGCRIGDHIQLRQLRVRWGHTYRVKTTRWPCRQ